MSISVRATLTSTLLGGSLVLAPTGARAATPSDGTGRAVRAGAPCPDVLGAARFHAQLIEDRAIGPARGPSPAEFTALRKTSAALAAVRSDAVGPSPHGGHLRLTGTDARYNVFSLPTAELEKTRKVHLDVPEGAVTVVNVTGATYDQGATGTGGFLFLDESADAAGEAEADTDAGADRGTDPVRSRLLWNFPAATKIVKRGANPWPGTVLAPLAAVDLGKGGPLEGGLIARSLSGNGSAETRHHPFTGCLPTAPGPAPDGGGNRARVESGQPRPPTGTPTPTPTPTPTAAPVPAPRATVAASDAPTGPAPAAPTGTRDRGPSAVPATGAAGPGGADGGLALTGAGKAVPLAIGGAAVLAAGAAMVLVARRRRA
ncbi:choice-of-anchor A family protein [Streptomyces sp. NPDC048383]|uniref:choice-of-anchor A family protein n=1 Tax=Streptomyces sp. NPDC048383 TaxID=3155386 RepID=UPI00342822D1